MTEKQGLVALIIGCILIVPNIYWIVLAESIDFSIHITMQSILFNSVLTLFFLVLLNPLLKRISTHLALSSQDLVVIYVMINIASAISGHGAMQVLMPLIVYPFWYATPENDWANLFHNYIPSWLSVRDRGVLRNYYGGEASFLTPENIRAWATPILAWSVFIFALMFVMLCINSIMRRKWTEMEKLSYPMVQLPYSMVRQGTGLLSTRLLWLGFAIPAAINIMNGLHYINPSIPYIHVKLHNISRFFSERPWSAMGWTPISLYPFVIGLGFFIPVDLCFSLWFFFLFWKAQRVLWYSVGLSSTGLSPYAGGIFHSSAVQQASGALIGIFVISIWSSRKYLKGILVNVLRRQEDGKLGSGELMSYRLSLVGLAIGCMVILYFCYMAGMSMWVIALFFSIYFAISVAIARIRAEVGAPVHDVFYGNPDQLLTAALGTRILGPRNLSMFAMFWFICRGHYSDPMPFQLEGLKLADMIGMKSRKLLAPIMAATLMGIFTCFWVYMHLGYRIGMSNSGITNAHGWEAYSLLEQWLLNPTTHDYRVMLFISIGFLTAIFLTVMRTHFLWWPFHPAGYALANAWGVTVTWFPLFISWLLKVLILRYGGLKAHRRAAPFFMGLILGDFLTGSIWSILGTALRIPTYSFWVY